MSHGEVTLGNFQEECFGDHRRRRATGRNSSTHAFEAVDIMDKAKVHRLLRDHDSSGGTSTTASKKKNAISTSVQRKSWSKLTLTPVGYSSGLENQKGGLAEVVLTCTLRRLKKKEEKVHPRSRFVLVSAVPRQYLDSDI